MLLQSIWTATLDPLQTLRSVGRWKGIATSTRPTSVGTSWVASNRLRSLCSLPQTRQVLCPVSLLLRWCCRGWSAKAPHCSFKDPRYLDDHTSRESIEVRALVVYWLEDLSDLSRCSPFGSVMTSAFTSRGIHFVSYVQEDLGIPKYTVLRTSSVSHKMVS